MRISQNLKRLFCQYYSQKKGLLVIALVLSLVQSILLLPSVIFIKRIFDEDIPGGNVDGLLIHSSIIILFTIVQSVLSLVHRNHFLRIVKIGVEHLQRDFIKLLLYADKLVFDKIERASLVNRTVFDIEKIDKLICGFLGVVIPQVSLLCIGIIIMMFYNLSIGIATICIGFVAVITQKKLRKIVFSYIELYNNSKDRLAEYVSFLPTKMVLTKSRNNEEEELLKSENLTLTLKNSSLHTALKGWDMRVVSELVINVSATLLIVLGSIQILLGMASFGEIFGLYFIIVFLRRTATLLQNEWVNLNEGLVALDRVFEIVDMIGHAEDSSNKKIVAFTGNIEMQNVSFQYVESRTILRKINLQIRKGETILVTGVNGSGKSSIINLILGFYKPNNGFMMAEGFAYEDINLGSLRENIGYVPQQQVIFDGSLEENLLYGLKESSKELLAGIKDNPFVFNFIDGLENGWETELKAEGKNLSGGQIQYISILRALLQQPKMLILDEPTNHLDGETITSLIENIREKQDLSILIISHHKIFKTVVDYTYELVDGELIRL